VAEPAPASGPAGAPGKAKKNRMWLYIGAGVLALALLVMFTKKGSAEPTNEGTGQPLGGAGGGGGPELGGGGSGGSMAPTGGSTEQTFSPPEPPSGRNVRPGAGPLRPGEEREQEESSEGGNVRVRETGGERNPEQPAAAAPAAKGAAKVTAKREKAGAHKKPPAKAPAHHKPPAKKPAVKHPASHKAPAHKPAGRKPAAHKAPPPHKSTPRRKK
jgi:hypothetical protein